LPWRKLKIDIVLECSGRFTERNDAMKHLHSGAKKVIVSAPMDDADITIVPGVNDNDLIKDHKIISLASCTTNCLTPLVKVLNDNFSIQKGFMTTIHAYTASQKLLDSPHRKLRRSRAAALNIIPTSSGATKALCKVIPELEGRIDGLAMRVPVASGSIVDFTAELSGNFNVKEINNALKKASSTYLRGVMQYSEDELVSSDILGNLNSCIVDSLSTQVIGNMVKVLAWYDNEYGYSARMVDCVKKLKKFR
jgi:glyceraldehyde 3-phosphate dehydrogenase